MLSLLVSLTLLAGPRGLEAKDPASLVNQLEMRLPQWLVHKGDRKAMLANKVELAAVVKGFPINEGDRKRLEKAMLEDQKLKSDVTDFKDATRVLIVVTSGTTGVNFFDAKGQRCSIGLAPTGKPEASRYVLVDGPLVDTRAFESIAKSPDAAATVLFLEKKDGAWVAGAIPKPAPPDCTALLKKGAKAVYVAERSFYAEMDRYEESLEKIGVDSAALEGSTAKVKITGTGATATFTAEISRGDGVAKITDASGEVEILKPCTTK